MNKKSFFKATLVTVYTDYTECITFVPPILKFIHEILHKSSLRTNRHLKKNCNQFFVMNIAKERTLTTLRTNIRI